jgi:hypothetical protein
MARLLALVVPLVGVVTVPVTSQQAILHLPNFRCLCRVYAIEGSGTVTTPTIGGSGTVTTPTTGGSGTVTTPTIGGSGTVTTPTTGGSGTVTTDR